MKNSAEEIVLLMWLRGEGKMADRMLMSILSANKVIEE
jgi:hypothetical protein